MAYSQAQNKATQKYLAENKQQLRVWVGRGDLAIYKAFAVSQGKSLNALVVDLLNAAMLAAGQQPPNPQSKDRA